MVEWATDGFGYLLPRRPALCAFASVTYCVTSARKIECRGPVTDVGPFGTVLFAIPTIEQSGTQTIWPSAPPALRPSDPLAFGFRPPASAVRPQLRTGAAFVGQ
jgi:hypothetical protein